MPIQRPLQSNGSVRVTLDITDQVLKDTMALLKKRILVGIPADKALRDDGGDFNNAAIGYLNEFGQPHLNIPARPHLVPGVEHALPVATLYIENAGVHALNHRSSQIDSQLAAAGQACVDSVVLKITEGVPPPLAEATIYNRRHRKEAPTLGTTPLIDSGEYRQHISYVIEETD